MVKKEYTERLEVKITKDMHKRLKKRANADQASVGFIVRLAVEQELNTKGNDNAR